MGLAQNVLVEIVRGNVTLAGIAGALAQPPSRVASSVQRLKRRGFVSIEQPGGYQVTEAGAAWVSSGQTITRSQPGTPRPRTVTRGLRQRAWWVMRARRVPFSLPDLLCTLADGSEKDAASNLGRYLTALARSGFLRQMDNRQPGQAKHSNGHKRYLLARNNGRLAPVVRQSAGEVFDPNSGEVFAIGGRS